MRPRVLVSACLAGVHCRYDGGTRADPRIVEMVRRGEAVPVCPEQLGGLATPRASASLDARAPGRLVTAAGDDVTEAFQRGAEETLRLAALIGAREAILKERSPSCGSSQVWELGPDGEPRLVPGEGVTTARLRQAGISVRSENDLSPGGRGDEGDRSRP